MTAFVFKSWNALELIRAIRKTLPGTLKVKVELITHPGRGNTQTQTLIFKLKGIAEGKTGIIFTLEKGHKIVFPPIDESKGDSGDLSITRNRVKFTDADGVEVTIIPR